MVLEREKHAPRPAGTGETRYLCICRWSNGLFTLTVGFIPKIGGFTETNEIDAKASSLAGHCDMLPIAYVQLKGTRENCRGYASYPLPQNNPIPLLDMHSQKLSQGMNVPKVLENTQMCQEKLRGPTRPTQESPGP